LMERTKARQVSSGPLERHLFADQIDQADGVPQAFLDGVEIVQDQRIPS